MGNALRVWLLELRPRRNGPSCGGLLLSVHEAEQHGRYHGSDDCCRDVTQEVAHRHILLSEGVPAAPCSTSHIDPQDDASSGPFATVQTVVSGLFCVFSAFFFPVFPVFPVFPDTLKLL
nr:MAG TPA: hypothetical protein [Caudoviricetes sp.]